VDPSLEILVPINALVLTGLANFRVSPTRIRYRTAQEYLAGERQPWMRVMAPDCTTAIAGQNGLDMVADKRRFMAISK